MKKEWKPVNAAKRNSIKSVDRTRKILARHTYGYRVVTIQTGDRNW